MGHSPRLHAKSSKKKGNNHLMEAARWVAALLAALYLSWLLALQGRHSGSFGQWVYEGLILGLGASAFLLPLFIANGLLLYFKKEKGGGWITVSLGSLLCLFSTSSFFGLIVRFFHYPPEMGGGLLGAAIQGFLSQMIGGFGAFVLSLAASLLALQILMEVRWSKGLAWLARVVADDFESWRRSRRELGAQLAQAKAHPPAIPPPPPTPSLAEKIRASAVEVPAREKPSKSSNGNGTESRVRAADSETMPRAPAPPPDSPYADYKLPETQLLHLPSKSADRGKPQAGEIAAAIESLEQTLKNFDIDARVTGHSPGPVITRYEVSPAPGVKVSSIVALNNDIALAMKAKGIRIIAPIPGKAAIGIEIPNARPAHVVLREILESPALPPTASPLAFAVGLSSDGEPLAADLQKMPHLLVAGATNSGKSVLIHSLILSILFRARPDEVKFLMIDPKRLELTFYDGIPHLFDPMTTADKVSVVTNPKDAAKSLLAMVKVMERRYEAFQLFGVRNIDSYNKEADKRGKPREFFIVVVIDELADLMLVAQDNVEDSIQRLAQMARAVGIHLVLATQRPSVDVITGVIKANLPSRIALQVISKVDSKVILDSSGAESLQGKGDLLYLAAGSQKPDRCQGAYVSEEEIKKVADTLRAMGKPSYTSYELASKDGAAGDLSSYGVEPLEFSQALKLVMERRRVSQDLLKSQFGSSARATNILSLLEVKQMIHKPEGTNRWEINFDMIEGYLRQNFPQVPGDDRRTDR